MKYTFEPYKEDGSPRKWVGTFRPPYQETWDMLKEKGLIFRYQTNMYTIDIMPAYNSGLFDKPLYEEENE